MSVERVRQQRRPSSGERPTTRLIAQLNLSDVPNFPAYFGRNWDALNECFSDYFVLEAGGLGSEFGGRTGQQADVVKIAVVRYTRESNSGRRAADLSVVFETAPADAADTSALVRNVLAASWPG
jgi:barstar (barnase inhibitor)